MKTRLLLQLAAVATFSIAALNANARDNLPADVSEAFESADTFTLLSLDPDAQLRQVAEPRAKEKKGEKFQGWPILGKVSSLNREERKKLRDALSQGILENKGRVAACFNPRHGIHMQNAMESMDLVICFECEQIQIFRNGAKVSSLLTSGSQASFFNTQLSARKVPLAAGPK